MTASARAARRRRREVIPGGVNTCRRRSEPRLCFRRGRRRLSRGPRRPPLHRLPRRVRRDLPRPLAPGGHRSRRRARSRTPCCSASASPRPRCALAREDRRARARRSSRSWSATAARRRPTTRSGSRAASPAAQQIVKFQGCYNGFHDYVLRNVLSAPDAVGRRDPHSAGMLEAAVDATLVCRFNDLDDVRATLERHGERRRGDHRRAGRAQLARACSRAPASSHGLRGALRRVRQRC